MLSNPSPHVPEMLRLFAEEVQGRSSLARLVFNADNRRWYYHDVLADALMARNGAAVDLLLEYGVDPHHSFAVSAERAIPEPQVSLP